MTSDRNTDDLVPGRKYDPEDLVRRIGIFRGVSLTADADSVSLGEVVTFKESALKKSKDELEVSIVLSIDEPSKEISIASESASSIQSANTMIDTYGTSLAKTSSYSAGLGGSFAGIASFGLSAGSSDSTDQSLDEGKTSASEMSKLSSTYTMSKYYLEPRALLVVDTDLLEPTQEFAAAVKNLTAQEFDAAKISKLFRDFGTHICTRVSVGGWWRITATYKSTTSKQVVQMSREVSSAIEKTHSSQLGVSGGYMGATASFGSSNSDASSSSSGAESGTNDATMDTTGTTEVYQEWKGGVSGASPWQWRRSLDDKRNSNWKIIDRNIDECIGIWRFVTDPGLKTALCQEWVNSFLQSLGAAGSPEVDCTGDADLREFRAAALESDRASKLEEVQKAKNECEAKDGYHFDTSLESCELNICKCGDEYGESGADCPRDGAEACKENQRPLCREKAQCPQGYTVKTGTERLSGRLWSYDVDKDICCADVGSTSHYKIQFHTGGNCEFDDGFYFKIIDESKEPDACGGAQELSMDDRRKGGVEWARCIGDDVDDCQLQEDEIYTRSVDFGDWKGGIATHLCVYLNPDEGDEDDDDWCTVNEGTPGVFIYNSDIANEAQGLVGTIQSFDVLSRECKCKSIQRRY